VRAERISSPAIIVVGEVTRAAAEAVLAASASEPIAAETQRHRAG
jgi:hypothetical protein